jgi:hypothetical protein
MKDFDDDELEDIADKIQVGDRTEGAQALKTLIERAGGSADVGQAVRREFAAMRQQAETTEALEGFAKKYPQLKDNHLLVDAAKRVVGIEIANDLAAAGVAENDLAGVRDNPDQLINAYGYARARGMRLRSPGEILDATGETLTREFNLRPARGGRGPEQVLREMRTARGYANDDAHIRTVQPAVAAADDARRAKARDYIANARKVRGYDNADAY